MSNMVRPNKKFVLLSVLCSVVYFVSYLTRLNLAASMLTLVTEGFTTEKIVALALSVSSIVYGAGQIISGALSDKFKPQNVLFWGLLITCATNFLVGVLPDGRYLPVLWGINGFAQALMWPPIVSVLSSNLTTDEYNRACVWVTWGSSAATIAVYGMVPLMIKIGDFRYVFLSAGMCALVMAPVWKILYEKNFGKCEHIARAEHENTQTASARFGMSEFLIITVIIVAIIFQGALRDGITNWTPTFISQTCNLGASTSTLTGMILPIFQIFSIYLVSYLSRRWIRNEMHCAGVFFAAAGVAAVLLSILGKMGAIPSIVLIAVMVSSMHGVNLILICMVPARFHKYGHVSLVSGILNSSVYIGAAISTYVIAIYSEKFGWNSTILLWAGIAAAGVLTCVLLGKRWKLFVKDGFK